MPVTHERITFQNGIHKRQKNRINYQSVLYGIEASDDVPGSDEGEKEQLEETPIDNWQLLLMLVAISIGVYFLAKYRKKMEVWIIW